MRSYVYAVYRYGSNAANQSRCNKMVVGTIEATSRAEACRLMADEVTVYHNQRLEAVPASKVGKTERQIAAKLDAWRAAAAADRAAWLEIAAECAAWLGADRDVVKATKD